MTQEPPPHSLTFRHGKTIVVARGAGLIALILIAVIAAGLIAVYLGLGQQP